MKTEFKIERVSNGFILSSEGMPKKIARDAKALNRELEGVLNQTLNLLEISDEATLVIEGKNQETLREKA